MRQKARDKTRRGYPVNVNGWGWNITTKTVKGVVGMKAYRIEDGDSWPNVLVGPNEFRCELGEPEDRTWVRDGSDVVEELNRLHELLEKQKTFHRDSVAEVEPEQAISCEVREENGK